jgi:hypothetical protein
LSRGAVERLVPSGTGGEEQKAESSEELVGRRR